MMSKNKACRWSLLSASLSALVAALACPAYAQQADSAASQSLADSGRGAISTSGLSLVSAGTDEAARDASQSQELYLEVSLNQSRTGQLARFVLLDDRLYANAATLRKLGLQWPGSDTASGLIALDQVPGLKADYDAGNQRIALDATLDLLDKEPTRLGFSQPDPPRIDPATRTPGLILNYDLYGQHTETQSSLSGWHELRLFGLGQGVWSNTMSSRVINGAYDEGTGEELSRHDHVRLDTSWQLDLPDRMLSLTVGDTITGSVSWSRATRIGGIRLSRNFSLQPYRITAPLASFAGEAALPSTVDLLINGLKQSSQQVQPGQFQIDSAPTLSGMGQAQLVITDLNGQRRVVSFSLYGSPQLLQAGLADWSLEAGMVRRKFGQESFSYADDPMLSASGRYGLSDSTTLEAHAESTQGLQLAGAGGVWLLGRRAGVFSASAAASRYHGLAGNQLGGSYQWNSSLFNLFLGSTRRDADFRDVASLEGALPPRRTDQAFVGMNSPLGQWGVSYVAQRYTENDPSRFASLSWSRQLPRHGSLNLNVSRDLEREDGYNAFLSWSMPLDRYITTSASARHSRNTQSITAEVSRSVPSDLGGWGWRAESTLGDNTSGRAQVTRLGRFGQWTAGVDHWRGGDGADSITTTYATANGGLLLMGGHFHAMRRVDDAFALVSTNGVPGVPIKLENRLVGFTDKHGQLLINRLNAWQRNQLSIDPLQLPADMLIERTGMEAVPESRSGMLAEFSMRRILSLQLTLRDTQGQWLPAGSAVWIPKSAQDQQEAGPPYTVVGHDGLVYLQDPPAHGRLRVQTANGTCYATLPDLPKPEGLVDLGELTCH